MMVQHPTLRDVGQGQIHFLRFSIVVVDFAHFFIAFSCLCKVMITNYENSAIFSCILLSGVAESSSRPANRVGIL
jgi:hypothetical protein